VSPKDVEIGQQVVVRIDKSMPSTEIIVGVMAYAEKDDVVLVASQSTLGMPVNTCWIEPTGVVFSNEAYFLRNRYEQAFPNRLKPYLPANQQATNDKE
jgi:hypothetical protein